MQDNTKTLRQLLPELTDKQRCRLGESLATQGVHRSGQKVKEGRYYVNQYSSSYWPQILKTAKSLTNYKRSKRTRLAHSKVSRP